MSKAKTETDVVALYRAFQTWRRATESHAKHIAVPAPEEDLAVAEQDVVQLYRAFQEQRRVSHQQIMDEVMGVARKTIAERQSAPAEASLTPSPRRSRLQRFREAAEQWWQGHRRPAMAMAAAVLVVAVVLPLLILNPEPPAETLAMEKLKQHAQTVSRPIDPLGLPAMAFSGGTEKRQIAFRFGVMIVDLQVLAVTDDRDRFQALTDKIHGLVNLIKNDSLSRSLTSLHEQTGAATGNGQMAHAVNQFIQTANTHFTNTNPDQANMYALGKQLEMTLLAYNLPDANPFIANLLDNTKQYTLSLKPDLTPVPGAKKLLSQLEKIPDLGGSPTQAQMRTVFDKLRAIKAVLL